MTGDRLHFIGTATTVMSLGSFTLLTDPNFLHRGQRAYLGWGLSTRAPDRPGDRAGTASGDRCRAALPPARRPLRPRQSRAPRPVRAGAVDPACRTPLGWGFDARALETWDQHTLEKGGEELRVTAVPAVHARGLLGRMLPPVMGSVLEHVVGGEVRRRVYVSGDTLTGAHVDEVRERFPDIDAAVVHLGGTRVLLRTVTMDGPMGVDFVERARPKVVVPVHYDDYTVFRSGLDDFVTRAGARRARGTAAVSRPWRGGEPRRQVPPCPDAQSRAVGRSTGRPSSGATSPRMDGLGARPSSAASNRR